MNLIILLNLQEKIKKAHYTPKAFDDNIIRSEEEYSNTINNIEMIKKEKITMEQGRSM